jgi:ABC-type iron transport system FetAB ATPase subunit
MPLLEVRDLRRDVGDRTILTGISFVLDEGDLLFVRGPSGVGKSLLLRTIACLDHAQVRQSREAPTVSERGAPRSAP